MFFAFEQLQFNNLIILVLCLERIASPLLLDFIARLRMLLKNLRIQSSITTEKSKTSMAFVVAASVVHVLTVLTSKGIEVELSTFEEEHFWNLIFTGGKLSF